MPYGVAHKSRSNIHATLDIDMAGYLQHSHSPIAGPSSRIHGACCLLVVQRLVFQAFYTGGGIEEGKKEKRRKDLSGKLGKEMNDRREE